MEKILCETDELNGSSYVKFPLTSPAILNIENGDDKFCFNWSILAHLHPCNNSLLNRVSNYRQYFDELNIESSDFTNGSKFNDMRKYEKLNSLFLNIFELSIYQGQNKRRHELIPIENKKNQTESFIY